MTRRNLGVAGEIELAQMAALPPFAQVVADMDGLDTSRLAPWMHVRSWRKTYHANFVRFHYVRGNRIRSRGRIIFPITGDDPC